MLALFVVVFVVGPLLGLLAALWLLGPARKEHEELQARWSDLKREVLRPFERPVRWLNRRLGGR